MRSKRPLKEKNEAPEADGEAPEEQMEQLQVDEPAVNGTAEAAEAEEALQKKIRNLTKKVGRLRQSQQVGLTGFLQLRAIEELKERKKNGEQLERTQHRKIESEAEVQAELDAMGKPAGG